MIYICSESTKRNVIFSNNSPFAKANGISNTIAACHTLALNDWEVFDVEIETLRVHTVKLSSDELINVGNKKFYGKDCKVYHILFKIHDLEEKISRLYSYTAVYYDSEIEF